MARLAVIGAGPIGLAAAFGAVERGFDVTVFERGGIGQSLRSWGATRFFSPLGMNVSRAMRVLLPGSLSDDALLAGGEYIEQVLEPVAARLGDRVRTQTRVVAVGRRGLTRSDYAGHPLRAERPFRLLIEHGGHEETIEAEVVLDASGGYVIPSAIGAGGLPAIGESSLKGSPIRTLGALHAERERLRGRRVLLVGNGHSAANAIGVLCDISGVEVTWAVRSPNRRPCQEVFNDALPERQRVVAAANAIAEAPPAHVIVERRAMVERVEERDGETHVTLSGGRSIVCDAIAAFTGYRPDPSLQLELAVDVSAVTGGGARLHRAISNVTDCLTVPRANAADLQSGEPGFFFAGSRAYGSAPSFLLQNGLVQLETILQSLTP